MNKRTGGNRKRTHKEGPPRFILKKYTNIKWKLSYYEELKLILG